MKMEPTIHAIVAMTDNRVIGNRGALPWKLRGDLPRFKKITSGHTVIMGKNTYDSIGRPLPDRHNIVLSHEQGAISGCEVASSVDEALQKAAAHGTDIFVIGGASIYEQMMPLVSVLHVSHVRKDYPGDVYFPVIDWSAWQEVAVQQYDDFIAKTYARAK